MKFRAPLFWGIAFFSVVVALMSFRFVILGVDAAFPALLANPGASRAVFMTHVITASLALAIAVPQFLPRLRAKQRWLHRLLGRVYAVAVLAGGISGGLLAIAAMPDRPVAGTGFGLLAVLWLGITGRAVLLARRGQLDRHRVWMMRSFALTFAAVTLRLQLPLFFVAGFDYAAASNWVGWSCWVPNLIVVEWVRRREYGVTRRSGAEPETAPAA